MRLLIKTGKLLFFLVSLQIILPSLVKAHWTTPQPSTSYVEKLLALPWWGYGIFLLLMIGCTVILYRGIKRKKRVKAPLVINNDETPITIKRLGLAVIPGNAQTIGSREEQQDAFGFSDIDEEEFIGNWGVLAVLADGMGGLQGGREVSHIAVQTFLEQYEQSTEIKSIPQKLTAALETANERILNYAHERGLTGQVGTTLVAAVVYREELYWLSVGDSRIYLNNGESLAQLTTEHKYAKELDEKVALGILSSEEALVDPQRESLTSFLGLEKLEQVDISKEALPLTKGDSVILCSDGLYGTLSNDEIREVCQYLPTQEAAEELIELVLSKQIPNQDNATVAILTME